MLQARRDIERRVRLSEPDRRGPVRRLTRGSILGHTDGDTLTQM